MEHNLKKCCGGSGIGKYTNEKTGIRTTWSKPPRPCPPSPVPQPASKNTCWFLLSPFMFHTNQETTAWRHCGQVTESVSEEEEAEELQRCDWILMSDLHVFAGQMVWMRWQKDQEVEHVLQPVITLVFSPFSYHHRLSVSSALLPPYLLLFLLVRPTLKLGRTEIM